MFPPTIYSLTLSRSLSLQFAPLTNSKSTIIKSTIKPEQSLAILQSLQRLLSFSINSLTIILAQSVSTETRLSVKQCAQTYLSNSACFSLANPLSSAGEDDSPPNQLRPSKAMPMVVTALLAYSLTIFSCLDGLHPSLHYPSIVKLNGQKSGSHKWWLILNQPTFCTY